MDSYDVKVHTESETFSGVASTINKDEDGEYLILKEAEAKLIAIRADLIYKIDVLTRPCRFSTFDFR